MCSSERPQIEVLHGMMVALGFMWHGGTFKIGALVIMIVVFCPGPGHGPFHGHGHGYGHGHGFAWHGMMVAQGFMWHDGTFKIGTTVIMIVVYSPGHGHGHGNGHGHSHDFVWHNVLKIRSVIQQT